MDRLYLTLHASVQAITWGRQPSLPPADPRFASCNFIPANHINPISAAMLAKLVQPTQAGYTNNYFVVNGYDTTYHKIDANHIGQNETLQIRAEVFNLTNMPHFSNPNANISNVTFNADGSIGALNGVGGISSTDRTGRQYDEGEWRFGARFGF